MHAADRADPEPKALACYGLWLPERARMLVCRLPSKSPWLNPIEPKWAHGKRAVVEPTRQLTEAELQQRLCAYYRTPPLQPLAQQVA